MRNKIEYNLEKLLWEYKVNIPAIQRDYAFGRMGNKNETKREKFVEKLVNVIFDSNKNIHLDFIYGKKEDEIFILLDGQQRITTLWLLDLYIEKQLENESKLYLSNFSYDTRTSTREFCKALIKEKWNLSKIKGDKVISYFQNQKWFFNSWRKDPTITGMCVVLEHIHKKLMNENLNNKNIQNITFSFLNIQELGQPEELYVKMNSRGKQLSEWDIFKTELFEFIAEKNWNDFNADDFEKWIDGEFIDFFWSLGTDGEDKSRNTEKRMLRFLYLLLFIDTLDKEDVDTEELKDDSRENEKTDEILNSVINEWREKDKINSTFLKQVKIFVEFIENNKTDIKEIEFIRFDEKGLRINELIEKILNPKNDNFLADIDLLYSYYRFALKNNNEKYLNINELKQIIRITSNFEETYRKQLSIEKPFIKAIKSAIDSEGGILDYFANYDLSKINFGAYSKEQKNEEIIKAKLLLDSSSEWHNEIYSAEKHSYFNGIIGWILRISDDDLEDFKLHSNEILSKFNKDGIIRKEEIGRILKYKDIRIGELFPRNVGDSANNLERDKSWKKIFREAGYKDEEEDISWIKKWSYKEGIIEENIEYWRKWFIFYPELLFQEHIGGLRERLDSHSRMFGNLWKNHQFSGKKYDIPLLIARIRIDDITDYDGFSSEGDETYAKCDNYKIFFNYDSKKYEIYLEIRLIGEADASDVSKAVFNLANKLNELKNMKKRHF